MNLTDRQEEVYQAMEPGRWFNCKQLNTSRSTMSALHKAKLVKKRTSAQKGFVKIDTGVEFMKPEKS